MGAPGLRSRWAWVIEMQYQDLEIWFDRMGLTTDANRAAALFVTKVTLRNWRRAGSTPPYLTAFCLGYARLANLRDAESLDAMSGRRMTAEEVRERMSDLCIENQKALGDVFALTKQTVSLWFARGRFPRWLNVAMHGLGAKNEERTGVVKSNKLTLHAQNL